MKSIETIIGKGAYSGHLILINYSSTNICILFNFNLHLTPNLFAVNLPLL